MNSHHQTTHVMNSKYWEEDIETMPREALQALQLQRLKKTIRIASHSPYYGKVFKERGITADDLHSVEEIYSIIQNFIMQQRSRS